MGTWKGNKFWEADKIKVELIDFLLAEPGVKYDLLVNEAPFLRANRWADLVAIKDGETIGFEIKSERDSLRTLADQLADYAKTFNLVYLVIAERFSKKNEISAMSKNIGLIIVKPDGTPIMQRKAISKVKLDKQALLSILWRKDLEKLAPSKRNAEMESLQEYVFKNSSIKSIQAQVIISLKERYAKSYQLFLKDRGTYTTIEDLRTITKLKSLQIVVSDTNIA